MQPADNVALPYRVIHLPLAFNEKWTHDAINRWGCQEWGGRVGAGAAAGPMKAAHEIHRMMGKPEAWGSVCPAAQRLSAKEPALAQRCLPAMHAAPGSTTLHDHLPRSYMRSVRSEAPYLPSNVKFVAANNGEANCWE
jgi:hypothetical protein